MIEIVHKLRRASGSKRKLKILNEYNRDYNWQRFLKATYDKSINYWVSAPADSTYKTGEDLDYDRMFSMFTELSTGMYKGSQGQRFARELSRQYGEIARLVLNGSIKAGVSVKTINKAYPGLIPEFLVMLAEKAKPTKFPVLASTKFDGVRCIVFVRPTGVKIKTRNGKELPISSLMDSMHGLTHGVYDGELVHGNGMQASRTKITGLVNKVLKGTATDIEGYTFQAFDYLTLDEWSNKKCTTPYNIRWQKCQEYLQGCYHAMPVSQELLYSAEEVQREFNHRIQCGFEGLILRYLDDPYLWKRSALLMKQKAIYDCVLRCVDVIYGKGKYEGMIGSLVCEGKINGMSINVNVGTGLNDPDRERPDDYYIGENIDIEYNDVVKAEGAEHYSLFLPVYKRRA